jgi:hypothetical protein
LETVFERFGAARTLAHMQREEVTQMQWAIPSIRLVAAAIASVLMLISLVAVNVTGDGVSPARGHELQILPNDGCPPTC